MSAVKKLLTERGESYGDAWQFTGSMVKPVRHRVADLAENSPEIYLPWTMILNKLARILVTPHHTDHWRDIIGYATLVLDWLEGPKEM